ncbi:hypothetical protein HKX48_008910 [Thoreauomyces humboldtii]|nr:hypothetical protein HKX48_008910 [Thoreauomyces humboldtii]
MRRTTSSLLCLSPSFIGLLLLLTALTTPLLASADVTTLPQQCPGDTHTAWALIPGDFPNSYLNQTFKQTDMVSAASTQCECATQCQNTNGCSFFTWIPAKTSCTVRFLPHRIVATTVFMPGPTWLLPFQDITVPWFDPATGIQLPSPLPFEIPNASPINNIADIDTCVQRCQLTANCVVVNYRVTTQQCFLKQIDTVAGTYIGVRTGVAYPSSSNNNNNNTSIGTTTVLTNPVPQSSNNNWKIGAAAAAVVVAVLLVIGAILFFRRRQKKRQRYTDSITSVMGADVAHANANKNMTINTALLPPGSRTSSTVESGTTYNRDNMSSPEVAGPPDHETYAQYMEHLVGGGGGVSTGTPSWVASSIAGGHRPVSSVAYTAVSGGSTTPSTSTPTGKLAEVVEESHASHHHAAPPQYMTLPPARHSVLTDSSLLESRYDTEADSEMEVGTTGGTRNSVGVGRSSSMGLEPGPPWSPTSVTPSESVSEVTAAARGTQGTVVMDIPAPTRPPPPMPTPMPLAPDDFFMDRVHLVKRTYTPKAPDEIEVQVGDSVVVTRLWGDGWATGVNTTKGGAQGVLPLAALGLGPNGEKL